MPRSPAVEAVLTMTPFFHGRNTFERTSLDRRKVPLTLTRKMSSNCCSDVVTALPATPMPALLQRMSSPPATMRSQSSALETSPARAAALPLAFLTSATVSSAAFGEMSATATLAPSRANARAAAWPMPDPAPVMRTTLFLNRGVMADDLLRGAGWRQAIGAGYRARCDSPDDGVNLNRAFPGDARGSITSKIADFIMRRIFPQVHVVLDLHAGGQVSLFSSMASMHEVADAGPSNRSHGRT